MKIARTVNDHVILRMTKAEWESTGRKSGWVRKAAWELPEDYQAIREKRFEELDNMSTPRHDSRMVSPEREIDSLREVDVAYSFVKIDPFQKRFEYDALHVPSGKKFRKTVWCYSYDDFLKLLKHWNRTESWKYMDMADNKRR